MTERVDFYVLKSRTVEERWHFGCRLTEKAYLRELKVVVAGDTAADVETLDRLLWTFDERSFVPHDVRRDASAPVATAPVVLTHDLDTIDAADLLVNLSNRLPGRLERFARVAEIIDADEERRRAGRERFKAYRQLELAVETHQLDDSAGSARSHDR